MEKDPEVRLIDVSSEDDCLISSSTSGFLGNQSDHEYFQLSEVSTELAQERKGAVNLIVERKQEFMLSDSSEPERTKQTGKCNLRKSLAWDNAFFTSAGVLEPEELSIINCGLKKAALHTLPGIEEDIRRSSESNSTLDSGNLTLESLEVGLFDDIRASIQRSSEASNTTYSVSAAGPREHVVHSLQSSRKMEFTSQNKSMPGSKRQTTTQGLEKTKKEPEIPKKEAEKTKREAWGTKKEVSVRPRAVQAAPLAGELNTLSVRTSSLRPPKIAGKINPAPTSPNKKASLGANRVKIQNSTAKSSIGRREAIGSLKRPVLGDPSVFSRSTPSPKSSSSSSASGAKVELAASCSSRDRSGSISSDSTDKSPISSLRNKTKSRNVNLPSTLKTPLRISSKHKTETGSSRVAAYLISVSKLSSSISPASSLDGWSSESSSSASVNQHPNSSTKSLDVSSPRKGFYLERGASRSDMQKHQQDQHCVEQKRTGLPSPSSKKIMSGVGSLVRSVGTNVSRSSKPSGLRMPSPKIGFFDAEKATEPTRCGSSEFHPGVRSAIPKNGAAGVGSLHGGTIRAKPGTLQPARSMSGRSSINCGSQMDGVSQSASSTRPTRPVHAQELSNAAANVSTTKMSRGICPSITSTPQNDSRGVMGSHLMMIAEGERNNTSRKSLGSSLNEGDNSAQSDIVNDTGIRSEQVNATGENSPDATSKLQNGIYPSSAIERQLKGGEVRGSECLSSFLNEGGNNSPYSSAKKIGITSEQVYAKNSTSETSRGITSKLRNVMCHSSAIERHLKSEDVEGWSNTETECSSSFLNEGGDNGQYFTHRRGSGEMRETESEILSRKEGVDAFVKDISSLSEKQHLHISSMMKTTSSENGASCCHDESNEKENSVCYGNQVDDGLSRCMDLKGEECSGKDEYEGMTDNPEGMAKSSLSAFVHGQVLSNASLSPSSTDILPITRPPLAVKLSMCTETGVSEFAPDKGVVPDNS